MRKWTQLLASWLPALLMMLVIFLVSAQSPSNLPDFDGLDRVVKKGGHIFGYALLAVAYWRGLQFEANKRWIAWLLALFFALSDEFHQSFVPGRGASLWDVMLFDNLGALIGLWLESCSGKQKRPGPVPAGAEQAGR